MSDTQRNYIIAAVVAIVIIALGAYIFIHGHVPNAPAGTETASSTQTSTTSGTVINNGNYTIHALGSSATPPDFTSKPLTFDASVGADVRAALNTQFATVKAELATNPLDFNALVGLASIRNVAGDEASAVEIWKYLSQAAPTNKVTFFNLGNYYMNTVKDYPQAETDYLQAIKNDPANLDSYKNLFQMYTTVYKTGTSAAEDILKKGIANNPKAYDLQVLLARYYKSAGRTADAKAQYAAAIANAKSQGQANVATQIQTEENGQ